MHALLVQLIAYSPPPPSLTVKNPDRKWEVVSAYQKSVRRANKEQALRMVSAMLTLPKEIPYFWRRVVVTACEDVGPANPPLALFVTACASLYKPASAASWQDKVLCFLTEQMCDSQRSRVWCQYSIVEGCLKSGLKPDVMHETCDAVLALKYDPSPFQQWVKKQNAVSEGMLKFMLLPELGLYESDWTSPEVVLLYGLPDYCYDMHTRVGKGMLYRAMNFHQFKPLLKDCNDKVKALGYALFFMEGGKIDKALASASLSVLEMQMVASKFGVEVGAFLELLKAVGVALTDGTVNKIRQEQLVKAYG